MIPFLVLIFIGVIIMILVMPFVAISRASVAMSAANSAKTQADRANSNSASLDWKLIQLGKQVDELAARVGEFEQSAGRQEYHAAPAATASPRPAAVETEPVEEIGQPDSTEPPKPASHSTIALPPLSPVANVEAFQTDVTKPINEETSVTAEAEPVTPRKPLPRRPDSNATFYKPPQPERPQFSLEKFMGVRFFAWVGGLAFFLGVLFFVKLSIERGWISPELRTAIGFATGIALVAGGMRLNAGRIYTVLGQTLIATGIVVLYGMTFAAHSYYRFALFASPITALGLISLITGAAFLLSVRLSAQVIAILGMLGGFLSPVLCSTGTDNPAGLFGYIAILDIGVLAVARLRRWNYLAALAALGTAVMQFGWMNAFFRSEGYPEGAKTWVVVAVFIGFASLFTTAAWRSHRTRTNDDLFHSSAALGLCTSAMLAAFTFLSYGTITDRPGLLYTFVFLINVASLAAAWTQPRQYAAPAIAALATFLHIAGWTVARLTPGNLPAALAIYLIFGVLHTAFAVLWLRARQGQPARHAGWMPVGTLLLLLIATQRLPAIPLLFWPAVLAADIAIIAFAIRTRKLAPVFAALVLTLVTAASLLMKLPVTSSEGLNSFLVVLGGFTAVFAAAGAFLGTRILRDPVASSQDQEMARWLPACSTVLPFVLLILATLKIEITNPATIAGIALVLCLFLLELGRITSTVALAPSALFSTLALQAVWHARTYDPAHPVPALVWYLATYALFSVHPHIFRRQLAESRTPWAVAAISAIGTFGLVHQLVTQTWPNDMMGLLPAAFALPTLISFATVVRLHSKDNAARLSQLAWFGGTALLFVTLVFPIQFEKQWLTVGWALEGAALFWLFRRVPHQGLRFAGAALLFISFVRLAINPAVLSYQIRSGYPIWNWMLYAYGITAAAQILAARWIRPPDHRLAGWDLRGVFYTFSGILLFLLLNLEIADAFTPVGARSIVFEFSGHFGRDMTYSIAWGLFALALLVIGLLKKTPPVRYAGIGLLALTLVKLFLHDLANIDSGYRIGALMAVAVTALAASFLYKRLLDKEPEDTQP